MAVARQQVTKRFALYHTDCMEILSALPKASIGLTCYSPPFGSDQGALYNYTSADQDLSNSKDYAEFLEHYGFIVREVARVTKPGRMTAVHCTDIPTGNTGNDALIDFPGDIIRLHEREGWKYTARYSVWKEPFSVYLRTMQKTLRHKTIVDDSSKCSVANADYLLVFRNRGKNPSPIAHPEGLMEYLGERKIPNEVLKYRGWRGDQKQNKYSQWIWRQYASAFWDDIRFNRILPFHKTQDDESEKHVHPLQLDVIGRIVTLWSNPGDTVMTPFAGVGSEVYESVRLGRKALGTEIKGSYYDQALKNVAQAETGLLEQRRGEDLFAGLEEESMG